MDSKVLNFVLLTLIISGMVINNLEGLYTFKMVFNSFAMIVFVLVGCERLYRDTQKDKKSIKQKV